MPLFNQVQIPVVHQAGHDLLNPSGACGDEIKNPTSYQSVRLTPQKNILSSQMESRGPGSLRTTAVYRI